MTGRHYLKGPVIIYDQGGDRVQMTFYKKILVQFAYKFAQDMFIIKASDAALRFLNISDIFGNQGATRGPPP